MTREEIEKDRYYQLTDAAINYCHKEYPHYDGEALGEITDSFEAGAEWEHKRLVEKACDWLMTTSNFYQGGSNALPEVICMFDTINEMVDSFRKEMTDNFQKVMEE